MHLVPLFLVFVLLHAVFLAPGNLWGMQIPNLEAQASVRFGAQAVQTVLRWESMIGTNANADVQKKLAAVNDFFNQNIAYQWETEDYWSTPLETMGRGIGDCEDYAIAKYATLTLMGVPPSSLRLVYVKAKRGGLNQAHMVLAWYETPNAVPLIIDNLDYVIRPATERGDLQPVFSFNGEQLWVGTGPRPTKQQPTARLSRWGQVVEKIRLEGFTTGF
ncbi:transglutaminase-like cysteine peptidase [Luminiphilus sp. nBUS_16]|uniref:transglutaminase-like cysteine peptidase n=1 Tax=unclassified Luminiphilus TaxID=2633198 RepID=UPI003EBA6825